MAVADRTHVILRAACSVIAERGCDGMRMGDVARSAGVSSALALWDKNMKHVVEPGVFQVMTGPSSATATLKSAALTVAN